MHKHTGQELLYKIPPLFYVILGTLAGLWLLKNNFTVCTDGCINAIAGRNLLKLHRYPFIWTHSFYPVLISIF